MRDLFFVAFLIAMFAAAFKRPFLLILVYAYIDIVSPQRMSYYLLNSVPISLIAVAAAVLSWAAVDDKRDVRLAWRQLLLLALLGWCAFTTGRADFPIEAAEKWGWAWKSLAFAIFLPLTLRTKLRFEAILLFIILSLGTIVIVGGLKTVFSGGAGYGELNLIVDNNSGLFESSIISAVSVGVIPIILWLMRHGTVFPPDWRVKTFGYCLIFACLLMPIGTSARTGLVCVAVLGVLMLRDVKRRLPYLIGIAAVGLVALPFLPSTFTDRMSTIKSYQADASASTRLAVWKWTLDYVQEHPLGGGFDAYRANKIAYNKVEVTGEGANQTVTFSPEVDAGRAYHSAYFEMLGEQGWIGLALWLMIHFGGVFRMELIRRRYANAPPDEAWIAPLASALQHTHLIILIGALFVGIALNPFPYMLVGVQIGFDTYVTRRRKAAGFVPIGRARKPAAAHPA
ncbi:putative O-glycosylation ligase, exosortase A system-associated [Sphingomonas japonica]|uniref:O-glycosylation ligase (Exosortase A-associated) n=1 Tax=Sphingomonas japonica TaxID=511662 RepID=A0ABX0U221_9SPHN|nr:putative O-glycosylation ligase, exosortase A system-associated [Sphingomonas japonica]NIJ23751.1 putative O-glycosylation ligase (exosortase A-associated) [Sphingomonas japonica]